MADNKTAIVITATDQTRAAFSSVQGGLDKLGLSATALSGAMAGVVGAVSVGALASFARQTIDAADAMNDMAQRVGIGVRQLAGWELAARQSGTSMESVAKGVKGLSTYIVEHGDKLRGLGIDTRDANQAMIGLADSFAAMPDGMEKSAIATKLFGKAGAEMIPLLNLGSKGLQEAFSKADAYGKKMAELAPQADKFNDQLEELALYSKSAGINLAQFLVEGLNKTADSFLKARAAGLGFFQSLTGFGVRGLGESVEDAKKNSGEHLKRIRAEIADLEAKRDHANQFKGGENAQAYQGEINELVKKRNYYIALNADLVAEQYAGTDFGREGRGVRAADLRGLVAGEAAAEKKGTARRAGKTDLEKMLELAQKNELDAYYATGGEETMREVGEKRAMESARALQRENEALAKQAERVKDMVEPYRAVEREIAELNRLRDAGLITANEAAIAEAKVTQEYLDQHGALKDLKDTGEDAFKALTDAVENWGNKAADTFAEFVVEGKASFGDFVKQVEKDLIRLQAKKLMDPLMSQAGSAIDGFVGSLFGGSGGGFYPFGGAALDVGNFSANGNAFNRGELVAFAQGGIVNRPTLFPFARGTGLMGEAGPEAIMPLKRGRDGKLGVSGGSVVVNNHFAITGPVDARTQAQIAAAAGAATSRALARNR